MCLEPEILLVDEMLAVGDAAFQKTWSVVLRCNCDDVCQTL